MSINLAIQYPGRANAPTAGYPQGSFKNRSAPGVLDGSYLEQTWANDIHGFFQKLIKDAAITPNGTPDTALESQYFQALQALTDIRYAKLAGNSAQQFSVLAGTAGGHAVNLGQFLASYTSNGYQKLPSGIIIQWGVTPTIVSGGSLLVTYPIAFPNGATSVLATVGGGVPTQSYIPSIALSSASQVTISHWASAGAGASYLWLAIGF